MDTQLEAPAEQPAAPAASVEEKTGAVPPIGAEEPILPAEDQPPAPVVAPDKCSNPHDAPSENKRYVVELHKFVFTCPQCGTEYTL